MARDVVGWLDTREITSTGGGATVVLNYQTSPTKDDPPTGSLFMTMASVTISAGAAVTVTPMLHDVVGNPLARWLRWQLVAASQTAIWDATFRIWIAASTPGRRGRMSLPANTGRMSPRGATSSDLGTATGATNVLPGPGRTPFLV